MRRNLRRLGTAPARWRGAALLPAAVLAVHQLRYVLAYGGDYGHELSSRGDSYTAWLIPVCAGLMALVLGAALGRAAEAWRTGLERSHPRLSWSSLWVASTLMLIFCFCVQEWLEILLEPFHAGGYTEIFSAGGWTALPAAAAVAAVLVALVRGVRLALVVIARLGAKRRGRPLRRQLAGQRRPSGLRLVSPPPLADCQAGRAPPRAYATA